MDKYKLSREKGYFWLLKKTNFKWSIVGLVFILIASFLPYIENMVNQQTRFTISIILTLVAVIVVGLELEFRKGMIGFELMFILLYFILGILAYASQDLRAILALIGLIFIFLPLPSIINLLAEEKNLDKIKIIPPNSKRNLKINPKKEANK